jgi:hypothetical protein
VMSDIWSDVSSIVVERAKAYETYIKGDNQ